MPITSDLGGKNYVLGRGRAFFNRFTQAAIDAGITSSTMGQGERYLGNTPEFSTTSEGEDLDHFDSDSGVRVKDSSVQLQLDRTGSFTCDNIDRENLALMFLGSSNVVTQTAGTAVTYTVRVRRGMFYQLGESAALPTGLRNVASVTVGSGAGFSTVINPATNFEVDEVLGRIYVLPNAANITDDLEVRFTFNTLASTREQIISSSNSIYGALKFVANNPVGINRDYYYPYVKIAPDGDYNLKGDDWQSMSFTFEILQKGNLQSVYIDSRPVTA